MVYEDYITPDEAVSRNISDYSTEETLGEYTKTMLTMNLGYDGGGDDIEYSPDSWAIGYVYGCPYQYQKEIYYNLRKSYTTR